MKRFYTTILILLVGTGFSIINAQATYKLISDISYRTEVESDADDYIAERCKLDFYYPENKNDFITVVWFHGGGHTFTVREERGIPGTQPIVDEFAPLYFARSDAPPLILVTGDRELEMLGRYEENAYLWRMMKVAGHENTRLYELDAFNHSEMVSPALEILLKEINVLNKK